MICVCMAVSLICLSGCNVQMSNATTDSSLGIIPEGTTPLATEESTETTAQQTTEYMTYPPATVPQTTVGTTYPPATVPSFINGSTATTQMTSATTTQVISTTAETAMTETTTAQNPIVVPPVSGSIDFGGRTFTLLCSENSTWANWNTINEIYPNEKTDAISLSLEQRNKAIEELYHCEIKFIISDIPSHYVSADRVANRDTVDLFAETIFYHQNMLHRDVYYNLHALDIDLGASYFNQNWIDTFTIRTSEKGNTLYSVIGDFSFGELMDANVIFYNKSLFASKFPNIDLEELVESGIWTFDTMMAFVKEAAYDGGQGWNVESGEHIYGLHYHGAYPFFAAAGMSFVKNENGALRFDFAGLDEFSSAIDEILKIFEMDGARQMKLSPVSKEYIDDERVLFAAGTIAMAEEYHLGDGLGILPYPKMTAEQRYYATSLSVDYPFGYSIPSTVSDIATATAFFEVFAMHSEITMKPTIYEVYGEKYGSEDMIALIKESLIFDPAYYYWNGDIVKPIMDYVQSGQNRAASYFDRVGSKRFDEGYAKLLDAIKESEY